jgi:hypothetical protein
MPFHRFPHDFVYWDKVQNHEKIKNDLMSIIKNKNFNNTEKQGLEDAHTDFIPGMTVSDSDLMHPELTGEIWRILDEVMKNIFNDDNSFSPKFKKSEINNIWCTKYDKNGEFELHCHSYGQVTHKEYGEYIPSFSMIYILNDDNERNSTVFTKLDAKIPFIQQSEYHFNTHDIDDIGEGTLLVFPSTLYHRVKRVKVPNRITIAINIISSCD